VSEHQAEQRGSEVGPVGVASTVSTSSDPLIEQVMASVRETSVAEAPAIAPDHEAPPKLDPFKMEAPKAESPKVEPPKLEAVRADAPRPSAKIPIMSPGERPAGEPAASAAPRKHRFAAMAAVAVLATAAGAIGGALATGGLNHFAEASEVTGGNPTLEAAIARIDADIVALKAGLENTSRLGMSQFNKTSDRLDRVEKAQAEPAARLAKLSEAVEKLRTAGAAASAKDITGTVPQQPAVAAAPPQPAASPAPATAAPAKPETARLPTVEGWVLRNVSHGGALIEGRTGIYEVYAGDPVPGLGRIDAIRKQDGRWVVVTSRGLVVSR